MSRLRRLLLVRHGETDGESSVRFHGRADVALSDAGRAQMREAARQLAGEYVDLVVASPLRRAWEAAQALVVGGPVRIEPGFREIDFGRWEGLTAAEIEDQDPVLYREWRGRQPGFEFPDGEPRADFHKRVLEGLERLQASGASCVLVVAHKGPIRTVFEHLTGASLADGEPPLAGVVSVSRGADGTWRPGRRGSDPEGLDRG